MIFLMAGTSDARELASVIQFNGYPLLTSVVTENAARVLSEAGLPARYGRLNVNAMQALLQGIGATLLVDASHPFAEEAHRTAIDAARACNIPYIRYERATQTFGDGEGVIYVDSYEEAADVAFERKGSIMLTTGSKTLEVFTSRLLHDPDIRLVARMLPRVDNMEKCLLLGVDQKNIIAMQGPFSHALNIALFKHYETTLMITKESGSRGAVDEKVEAAQELGIDVVVIGRPNIPYGQTFSTVASVLAEIKKHRRT